MPLNKTQNPHVVVDFIDCIDSFVPTIRYIEIVRQSNSPVTTGCYKLAIMGLKASEQYLMSKSRPGTARFFVSRIARQGRDNPGFVFNIPASE